MCVLLATAMVPALTGCGQHPAAPAGTPARALPANPGSPDPSAARPTPPSQDVSVQGLPRSAPERVEIPRLDIDAPLAVMGLTDTGSVDTPPFSEPRTAGWYGGSVTPGQNGTSVIVGHVDTTSGPAVFYLLSLVRHGDTIEVKRADRSTAVFTVDAIKVIPDSVFDDRQVYANTPRPELRLITCGGTFDRAAQEYTSNVVVYAHLTGAQKPAGTTIR